MVTTISDPPQLQFCFEPFPKRIWYGIQFNVFKKYHDKQGGLANCGRRQKGSALGIKSVISAIIVQLLGIVLSISILVVEILVKKNLQTRDH